MRSLPPPGQRFLPDLAARMRRLRLIAFDFDGVFTDNSVFVLEDGTEAVRCSRSDGFGLRRLEQCGVEPIILSTEPNRVVLTRAQKLKVFARNGLDDKLGALQEEIAKRNVSAEEAGFVGNDINDLPCLQHVGLPVVVADAMPEVLHAALYRCSRAGGFGAVREICDLIVRVRITDTPDGRV